MSDLAGKKVLVVGLGRFGGGVGVTRWLVRQGADVLVTDLADRQSLAESLQKISDLPVKLRLGEHREEDFLGADLVVASPAVPRNSPYLQAARSRGIGVTTEICLFVERCPARVVGITGTVGKSTTAAMTAHLLKNVLRSEGDCRRRVWLGGNIGGSLLADLPEIDAQDIVVLELSSFQLEYLGEVRWSPHVAVITNLAPNHLDRHGNFAAYAGAKMNILRYRRRGEDHAVICDEQDLLRREVVRLLGGLDGLWRYRLTGDGRPEVVRQLPGEGGREVQVIWNDFKAPLPGRHNALNAAAAFAVALALGFGVERLKDALAGFRALPDRLEFVRRYRGVDYYNDSKATTPEAAIQAIEAFARPVVAIVGGYDKKVDLTDLAKVLARRAKAVLCVGQVGGRLANLVLRGRQAKRRPVVLRLRRFADAVMFAEMLSEPGDVVLLSPGCASYDMFVNYEHRGRAFKRIVLNLS